jgi:hypothetical protein
MLAKREVSIYERMHMLSPSMYGKYPLEKTHMEMRRAIKQIISGELPAEMSMPERRSPEMREMVFHRLMDNERLRKYFAGPEEMRVVFQSAYDDLLA